MNCANHTERTATAFCQNCGKPLCPECTRTADGLILCEPCLLARQASATTATGATPGSAWAPVAGAPYVGPMGTPVAGPGYQRVQASPVIAGLLGFIPGVGAMYNGQFIKALLHVVIFVILIGASEHFDLAGILITAWIFYQVFDAAQTAAARRDGRPLPDPFGILDLSQRLGPQVLQQNAPVPPVQPSAAGSAVPPAASYGYPPQQGAPYQAPAPPAGGAPADRFAPSSVPFEPAAGARWGSQAPQANWAGQAPPFVPTGAPMVPPARRGEPIGAIVLIIVGLLFLLSTLGVLQVDWITRGWPLLLLGLGIWLLIRRTRTPAGLNPPMSPVPSAYAPPANREAGLSRSPLSITPDPFITAQESRTTTEREEDKQ